MRGVYKDIIWNVLPLILKKNTRANLENSFGTHLYVAFGLSRPEHLCRNHMATQGQDRMVKREFSPKTFVIQDNPILRKD